MQEIRRSLERGYVDHGWLKSYHSFSFADYFDPRHMGFRSLRVINEDWVQPGQGFGTHPHRDMEIVTYVLEGALEHKDSMGSGSVIRPGEVQVMGAGTGVTHSEFNPSRSETVHLLQIWLLPRQEGLAPFYAQRRFDLEGAPGVLRLIVSGDGRDGSLELRSDADLYACALRKQQRAVHRLADGRHAWVQAARGRILLNTEPLAAGDGAAVSGERALEIGADEDSEFLLFELA
ncbi:MAG: pirin family protein [Gemmatimonadales bacterium]